VVINLASGRAPVHCAGQPKAAHPRHIQDRSGKGDTVRT
jgi:hypothetical protein